MTNQFQEKRVSQWNHLKDVDFSVNVKGTPVTFTIRITKTDHATNPYFSWVLGQRPDPQPFRPHLRTEVLNAESRVEFVAKFDKAFAMAEQIIADERARIRASLETSEMVRNELLSGKGSRDMQANTGLNAVGKTAKKRAKESMRKGAASS